MQVIDLTEGKVKSVSNVPYLLALPTYFATSTMYGFTSSIESVFNSDLTATEEYGKTGMTFGSALFRLSSKTIPTDANAQRRWHDFFLNCIKRDITINQKYTWQEVVNAPDIWGFLKGHKMSPLRGMYIDKGNYKTCKDAAPIIEREFESLSGVSLDRQAQIIYGEDYQIRAPLLKASIQDAYQRYAGISKHASDITKQNMAINAMRNSINDLSGAGGALNYAYTQNKAQTTSMWASIALQAKEFIPMMHTILFLLFGCASILVAVVAMIPSMTVSVLTNYVKTFATLAIWPALFAFLNFIMTTSLAQTTGGITNVFNGVTLSNINALDEMHTRFGLIAGYLMMSIPFLAGAIIKGGTAVMSNLSYQLSGMINSTNARTSAAASSGDLDFGNMRVDNQSYNNLGSNKRDDTLLNREGTGMSSTLGRDGVNTTEFGNGSKVYDAQSTYSSLGYSIASQDQVSQSINTAYNKQQAISDQQISQLSETTSTGVSMGDRLSKTSADSKSNNTTYGSTDSVNINKGIDKMDSAVESVMKNTGWTEEKSKSYVHSVSGGIDASISSPADFGLAKVSASASTRWSDDDAERFSTMNGTQEQEVKTALLQYRDGANMVSDAAVRTDASSGNSEQIQTARDFGGNWNTTKQQAQTANQSYAKTESLSTALNDSRSGSLSIGENLIDDFQRFVTKDINDSSPSGMSEKERDREVKNILTAQEGVDKGRRDDYLADFQRSDAFKLAVLEEALPTPKNMDDRYNQTPSPQLTQAQNNAHTEAVGDYVSYFSDKVTNGEPLFNQSQHDAQQNTVNSRIDSTELDINQRKEALSQPADNAPLKAEVEKEVNPPKIQAPRYSEYDAINNLNN
ncbi:Conjugative transfer protein TraG [Moritella viscosa]|nr:Conjugative transfer protein TraG [Moritella viscosa]